MITFEDQDRKSKKQADRKRDPYDLPESMIERYGSEIKLSKKEQKRLTQSKQAKPVLIDDLESATSNKPSSNNNKWAEIYGQTSGKMNELISKQAAGDDGKKGKNGRKNSQKGGKGGKHGGGKSGGGGRDMTKRFKLGHTI